MTDEYLASGFRDVDLCDDPKAYEDCLGVLDGMQYYREVKERSYELLGLAPGITVLDVGSGLGDDVFRMAKMVMPGGLVVGVDGSARMVDAARLRTPEGLSVRFEKADGRNLPFGDAAFGRARIDRTLQHITDPQRVLVEMVRVLEPGGFLLAYDNDWGTFSVPSADGEATEIIENLWRTAIANPWIGRDLKGYFAAEGLEGVRVHASTSVVTDFATADRIYNLSESARRAVEAGLLPVARAGRWLDDLQKSAAAGMFRCALTAYTVVGRKPVA